MTFEAGVRLFVWCGFRQPIKFAQFSCIARLARAAKRQHSSSSCPARPVHSLFPAVQTMAAISSACQQRIALNDGRQMPSFGLGVWQAPLGACKAAVLHALRCGYRHIDTAEVYGNEQDVGDALAIFLKERPDVQREDIWITTKFFPRHGAGRAAVVRACKDSLRKLRLQYVDLYLIHAPHTRERIEQYRALEALRAEGLCRSIGVSNYGIHHLEELLAVCTVPPCVNQVRGSASDASAPSTRRFHR